MDILQLSWQRTCKGLSLNDAHEALRDQLIAAYKEPQRHYHTLQHLAECMTLLSTLPPQPAIDASALAEIEMALWFHDAIYDVKGNDNEQKSADWAYSELLKAGVQSDAVHRIQSLIIATKHNTKPQLASEQLLVDVDLAILGATPTRFAQYDKQVRQEYAWVPEVMFRAKRIAILKQFLTSSFIYNTVYFRETYETQARENLQLTIAQLSAGITGRIASIYIAN